jgi:hypothetical protein
MTSAFKELNLNQQQVQSCLEEYFKYHNIDKYKYKKMRDDTSLAHHRIEYEQEESPVTVDFYFLKSGTTTISFKIGKSQDKGEVLAKYIKEKSITDPRKNVTLSIRNVNLEIFELLKVFISEEVNELDGVKNLFLEENTSGLDTNVLKIKVSSRYRDSATITYYKSTKTLLFQGKPLYTYFKILYFMTEYADFSSSLEIGYVGQKNVVISDIDVDENIVEDHLKKLLKYSYNELGDVIIKLLKTSYILKDINIPLPDYSCYVFPCLRALEGVIKKILKENDISVQNNNNSFAGMFETDGAAKNYVLTNEYKSRINDQKICTALGNCYTYFKRQRHGLFHMSDNVDFSRTIEDKENATQMIERVIDLIDNAYYIMKHKASCT